MSIFATRLIACGLVAGALLAGAASVAAEATLADLIEAGDTASARALLAKKVDVNAPQADGMTALHWAALRDDAPIVTELLAAGANAKAPNRYGVTPLALACRNGSAAVVEALLEAGADANSALAGGETVLMTASRTGRIGAVKALLARGADVNARERKNQTALMWAAAEGHADVVDSLLAAGADFRTPLTSGFTPFFFAVREGRTKVVSRLLAAGVNINDVMRPERGRLGKPTSPLLLAIENGHFELAAALLEAGADPNARPAGYAALHAISWVRKPIRGDGDPPPIGSGNLRSLDLVGQLMARGADINLRLEHGESGRGRFTTTGSTPFVLAARASDVALVRLLSELGADTKLANIDGCGALAAATGVGALSDGDESAGTEEEAFETARVLIELGADANSVDNHGETAMHGAAYQSRPKLVQLLAEHGADINVWNQKNKLGWTPLMIAQGHRPGNFRPDPDTIAAIERVMRAAGIEPPKFQRDLKGPRY